MKELLVYLKDYKKECILAPLFKMLEATFELVVPLVIADMIDNGIGSGRKDYLISRFVILLVLAIVGLLSSVSAQYFAAKAACGFSGNLRSSLFSHLLSLDFPDIDNIGTSTMITRMTSDVNSLQNGVNMFLRLFLRSPFIVIGAYVMSLTIDVRASFVFLATIIVLALIVTLITKINVGMLLRAGKSLDEVTSISREGLLGVRVIRAFVREKEQEEKFIQAATRLKDNAIKAGRISSLMNPLTYVMINMGIVVLIYVGAIEVGSGIITSGAVIALYNYMSQILVELIKFANLIISINKALVSAKRINEIFAITPGEDPADSKDGKFSLINDGEYAVSFDHVSLTYHEGSDEALSDISFKIKRGETVGIIGGTGSGKTSLVSLIPGYYLPSSGNISIFGEDISKLPKKLLRNRIGTVMQKAILFKGSIADNLRFGNPDATDDDLREALRLSACDEMVKEKGGLSYEIQQEGKNLSGGQKQRLSIARTLCMKPDILILDDSSSALDYLTDLKLRENIRTLKNMTVFIVSQRTVSIQNADHIIVLEDGRMVGFGTHSELLNNCEVYRDIYQTEN